MPLFEFVCEACQQEQELLIRGQEQPKCQQCGSSQLTKLLSVPAAHAATGKPPEPPAGPCGSQCGCFPG